MAFDAVDYGTIVNDGGEYNAHGNMCVGIIGANYYEAGDDSGICKNVDIIPIQCYDTFGTNESNSIFYESICTGVEEAAYYDANVINLSVVLPVASDYLQRVTIANNLLLVFGAGNQHLDFIYDYRTTGLRNDNSNWIVVGAVDKYNQIAEFSNWSSEYCDLFAYGYALSTSINSTWASFYGTSVSAPQVSAACALLWSKATHLDAAEIRELIMNNVTSVTSLDDKCVSGGVLNIKNCVLALYNEDRTQYGNYTKGDINNSGTVTSVDALMAKRIYNGSYSATAAQINAADVNNDGLVNLDDYELIQLYQAKSYYFPPI